MVHDARLRPQTGWKERALEVAWGIIANAYGGNWDLASEEWREAAERWRDQYMPLLSAELAAESHGEDT